MYDPGEQKLNREKRRKDGEWPEGLEDEVFPSTRIPNYQHPVRSEPSSKQSPAILDIRKSMKWPYWILRPSRRPLPFDVFLGGSPDLDALLFH